LTQEPCQCSDCQRFYKEHDRLIREFPTFKQQQELNWASIQSFRTLCTKITDKLQRELSERESNEDIILEEKHISDTEIAEALDELESVNAYLYSIEALMERIFDTKISKNIESKFKEVAKDKVTIEVTSDLNKIKSSDKVVLPGQGSFKSCVDALNKISGLVDVLKDFAITNKKPLLGICVGLQMFADIGYEEAETKGLGWISGKVSKIDNQNGKFKLPHIGWNEIEIQKESKIFKDIKNKSHMYFVHSYEFIPEDKSVISAITNYSSKIVCSVDKDNLFGTQFHPEKSDKIGLQIINNFINL